MLVAERSLELRCCFFGFACLAILNSDVVFMKFNSPSRGLPQEHFGGHTTFVDPTQSLVDLAILKFNNTRVTQPLETHASLGMYKQSWSEYGIEPTESIGEPLIAMVRRARIRSEKSAAVAVAVKWSSTGITVMHR